MTVLVFLEQNYQVKFFFRCTHIGTLHNHQSEEMAAVHETAQGQGRVCINLNCVELSLQFDHFVFP